MELKEIIWGYDRFKVSTLGPIVSLGKGEMEGKEEGRVERLVVYLRY